MNASGLTIWRSFSSRGRRRFVALVGIAIGLILFAPCALQGISATRAAQYETNESRSEYETNERIHASIPPSRGIKVKRLAPRFLYLLLQVEYAGNTMSRAISTNRNSVPAVVHWSASMRC